MTIGFIDLGGKRLESMQLAPQRRGMSVVLLHPVVASVAAWRGVARALCAAVPCTLLQLDACGDAPHRDPPQRMMDAIAALHASPTPAAR